VRAENVEHHLPDNQLYLGDQMINYINVPELANKNEVKTFFLKVEDIFCHCFRAKETV